MLEDHIYWVMVYWRWMNDDNFERGPANIFKRVPAFVRPLAKWKVRGKVRAQSARHGISRHNETEMTAHVRPGVRRAVAGAGRQPVPDGQ